ncbi:MAG: fibronectin type III domain-containing protein, partial [Bacteroidales bacterium]|nr:fibronectin type III domain-containing protein [Bacteroidales bacterium]
MKRKSTFLRMLALLALLLPWTLQAQNAKVSEYDFEVSSAAYTSIASTGTAWTQADIDAGYVDVDLPFAMYLGENQAAAHSNIRVYPDGHVVLNGLTGAEIAPLQYSAGYAVTTTSIRYQQTATNEMTIEWRKVVANGNVLSFQLKLADDGTVKFCYGPMGMTSSIQVFVGIQADGYIFRCGGSDWSEITRHTSGTTTRALNGTILPAYDVNTGIGTVYTFTQPACVKPTEITATATATSWNTVTVGWTVAEQGTKYQVAYSTTADFDPDAATFPASQIVTVNDPTARSTEITGLNSETTYYFAVRKYCDATTASGWLYKTTGTTTPESCPSPALTNFSLSAAGVASWNGLATSYPNITSVDIYYSTTLGTPDANVTPQFENVPVSTASVDLTTQNLEALTTYYVYFRAHCTIDGGNTTNWVGSRSFTTPCATETFPYYEDFDNWSSKSTCWSFLSGSYSTTPTATTSSSAWTLNTTYGDYIAISGKALTMNIYSTNRYWAVTPNIAITSDNAQVSVDVAVARWSAANPNYDDNDSFVIAASTDNGNTYTTLLQYSNTQLNALSGNYTTLTVPLTGYNGQTVRFAFYGGSEASGGDNRIAIDNIAVEVPPTCFQPTISSVTPDGLVSWTSVDGTASYEVVCVPTGNDVSTGTIVNAGTGTSYQLTGLESNTTYDVYLRSYCSATDQSRWSAAVTFTTACMALDLPYSEDFNSYTYPSYPYYGPATIPDCWEYINNGTNNASTSGSSVYYGGVVRYSSTGSYACITANDPYFGMCAYYTTSATNSTMLQRGSLKYALLPKFTTPLSNAMISFQYKMSTTNANSKLYLGYVTDNDTSNFQILATYNSVTTLQTVEQLVLGSLNANIPAGARLAFKWKAGTTTVWCGIDNVLVEAAPSCFKPMNVTASAITPTTATLSWNTTGAAQYEVEYGPAGFAQGTGRTVVVSTNSVDLDYLYMVTNYEAYVRSLCTGEDPSQWSNVCEFRTGCPNGGSATMGTGTTNTSGVILNSAWGNTYCQQIFTADELAAAGLQAGNIAGITITWSADGTYQKDFSIYMGNTNQENFSSTTAWVPIASQTLVYGPTLRPNSGTAGEQEYTFTTPFPWDGTSNIVISTFINQHGGSQTGSGFYSYSTNSGKTNVSMWKYRDSQAFTESEVDGLTASSRSGYRASITFISPCDTGACPAPSVVINGSQSGDFAVAELTFTDNSGETTPTYGYKCGLKGFDPASVTGITTTNTTATIGNLTGNTQYDLYVYAVCGGSEGNMVRYTFTTPMVYACKPQANFATSNVTYTSATVTWEQADPNQTPESWTVRFADHQIADMSAAAATEYTESTVITPTLALTGLHNGNTYYIYTKANCNALDVSPDWTEFSFTTLTVLQPDAIAATNITNRTADVFWTDNNTPATNNYTVRYADHQIADIDNAAATEYTELTLTEAEYSFTMSNPLDPAATYYVYVRANAGDEHSAWSVANVNTLCPAPVEVSMGDADGSNSYLPYYAFYNYSFSEQIYTAEELGGANTFSTLSYEVETTAPTRDGCTIYLVETNLSSFSSYADAISTTGLTPVFNGTLSGEQGWHTIEFDTPFAYSGNGNLVVIVDRAYTYYSNGGAFATVATTEPQGLYAYDDNVDITPENIGSASYKGVLNQKNNFVFGGCDATVTCIPPKDVAAQVSTTNEVTLTWATRENLMPVPTNFEVRYDVAGTTADECANVITDITALNATFSNGLVKNTDYVVYVASKCGANDYSPWQRVTFTTNPTCWDPSNLAVETALTTPSSVTLTWNNNATVPASRWQIAYAEGYVTDPEAATNIVDATTTEGTEITGLKHSTIYTFYVRAVCDETGEDVGNWIAPLYTATGCAAWTADDLPMTEDFSINVSGMPWCWSKLPATGTYPNSNNGYLWFYNNSTTDLYAVLPEVSVDVNTLDVAFDLYFDMEDNLIVGVMSDPVDATTFVPVVTLNSNDYNYNEYNNVTAQLADYTGTGHYVAFKVAGTNSDAYIYVDNLTLKVREASHPLADNGETVALCDQYLIPTISDQTNTYSPNVNATYIITPAEAGKVLKLKGDYNLEYGYDFLDVYEGTGANATLVTTLTGKGNYEYMTSSYDWAANGGFKLVFRTDGDNAMPNLNGFHFLATCECPEMVPDVEELAETVNGTYTWTAPNGDGNTYTHNVVLTGLTYGDPEETVDDLVNTYNYTQVNVAGCDSINKALTLTLHPTYSKTYDAEICQYDTFAFYGNEYTATGTYTVNLTSKDGADSVGILNLQVHTAPTVAINYNNKAVTTVENFCDNADMTLLARSNINGATFVWDDNSTNATRVVNPHVLNTYTVVATEPTYGCSSLTASVTVTTTPVPELSIAATDSVICRGESTTLTLTDANNTAATYTWSNNQTGNSITVTPTETTTYTATATTTTGACVATAEYTVIVNQLPVVTAAASVSTICSDSIITLTATEVDGYSYQWNTGAATATATTVATATADYTVTVTDDNGCVNEFTTAVVTVRPSYERDVTMDVCYTQNPYTWGAQQLTADGNYDQMFTAANGCDSLIHLNFTFQQMSVFNTPREVCEGTVLTWGPETVTATENTTVSYILNAGDIDPDNNVLECPAQYNLNLTVNHPAASSFERTVCDSTTWNVSGLTYYESGAYPYTLATTKGCDSVVTMNLTVNYHVFTEETVEHACDSYTWNTETYTEPGDYVQNFAGAKCDSTRTLHLLVVDNTTYGTDNILFCGDTASWIAGNTGYTWIDGETYTMSETDGNITHTLVGANANGCDSVSTLNLTLNPVAEVMNWTNVSACDEYSIDTISCDGVRGTKYINQSGDYWLRTPTTTAGRDVLTRIHLTINRSSYHTNVVTACVPYDWYVVIGQDEETGEDINYLVGTYNESGNISFQMPDQYSANGCNRIEVLRLTALQPTVETTEATICQNGSWQSPDQSVTYNGADLQLGENTKTWSRTTNEAGCNLDKKVVLTVNPVYNATAELTFCESEFTNNQLSVANALNANDEPVVLTIAGALNQTPYANSIVANWKTQDGCDSIVTINYTVNPTTYESVNVATCYRYTWDLNDSTYDESGSYTYNNEGANNYHCDNVVTLNLTINDSVVENVTEYHCSDYEYEGVTYRTTETFREVLEPTAEGCEHVRYVTHTIIPTQMTDLYVVTNMPYTWTTGNGQTYTESTDAIYESQTISYPGSNNTATSCDSILMLHLTIVDDTAEFCENELPYNYQLMNVTLDGDSNSVATIYQMPMGYSEYLDNSVLLSHYGVSSDVFTQWRSRLFADQHDGMRSVLGTQVHNYNSEYYTVELQVNGVSKATKTVHNLPSQEWIDIFFDTPVRISDDDVVDFIYSTTGSYAMLITLNGNGVYFPDNSQYRYNETDEWQPLTTYNYGNTTCGMNLQNWPIFGIDGYYYTGHDEVNHRDTILLYVVNPNLTETLNVTACDSYTWADGTGMTYTESGVYTYETTTVNGCDSTVTLNLTINVNSSDTLDAVVACDSYDWTYLGVAAGSFTESGIYTHNFIDGNGCASVATLPLTIHNSLNDTLAAVTACDSYVWVYDNDTVGTYTATGDQVYNFTDANNCNATITLPLTINASTERDETIVVNAASTYRNGNYYAASATPYYFDEYGTNAAGCPETVHITLIVHQGATEDVEVNACGEYTWEATNNGNGHTYQWISNAERMQNNALYKDITDPANPIYIHVGENPTFATYNVDSTINTTYILWLNLSEAGYQTVDLGNILLSQQNSLTVYGGNDTLDAQTIDLSDYVAAGQNATLNVQVRHNSPSNWYCGNIVTYTANLVWNYDTVYATVCDVTSYEWTAAGQTFAVTTGDDNYYTHTFNAGTDSEMVTTMNVTVTARTNSTPQVVDSCFTYTWAAGDGQTYTTSGTYYWNDDANCTLETLQLTIHDNSSYTMPAVAVCDSYTWVYNNDTVGTYTTSGDCTFDITDVNGCAATVTLPLTINKNHGHSSAATACDSYTWSANDGNDYVLDATQVKVVEYTDANTCVGHDTLTLTINESTNYTDVQTACGSFEWIVNGTTVGTYTETDSTATYTIANGNAAGCDSIVTLNLTVYNPRVFNREQYAYGNGITINGQFYEAPTTGVATYNLVLDTVDPEANDCPTVVNVTLHVSQYEYYYTNYVACGSYTWTVNNHTYRGLTDEEAAANPTALYFDETDTVVVTSNPMMTTGNRIDVLNLTINKPSVTEITRTVLMSQLEAGYTLTLEGNVEDFSAEYAAHQTTTVTRSYSLGAHAACDSIVNYTINLVWNYDTVLATVCDLTSYEWTAAEETFAVTTGDNYKTHVFNAGTETEQVTTMKVTVTARAEAPQAPVTVCDSYTWHGTEYTASANLEFNNDTNCTHETLALTINTNAGTDATVAECFTYTWNVPTYELDTTTDNYVAADAISNTYTEGGVKTVTFIDANGCEGTATLNLTIYADSTETLAAVTACDSYEWTYNNVVVGTYTEGGDKTYNWTDANGCAATATLPLTINNSASVNVEFWEGEGSYRYTGIYTTAPAQMLSASNTPYNFVETVAGATAEGCDSIYNITLHVGNYYYATETYRSCNSFTWERNNHTYTRLTDEQAAANPTALYFDETDNAVVLYNPTVNVPNEGTYDSLFMLQLTLDAIWSQTDVVNFPVSEGIFSYHGNDYDFTLTNDEGREFTDSTVTDTVHLVATTFCDSIYYVTINVYNNYREVETADICATTNEYTWRGQTISTVTNDFDNVHTYYIYDAINANDSVQYITITQHPVTYATERRTACDSYTWGLNGETYYDSTSNETYVSQDQYGCDSIVTLTLIINHSSSNFIETTVCDTYTWIANNAAQTEIGTYTATPNDTLRYEYISDEGCPSTDVLVLTVNHNTSTKYTVDECDSYTWENGDGLTYTASGVYTYDYNTTDGCPSTDTLDLTIRNNSNQTINKVVCDSYTWTAADGGNGETYTADTTVTYEYAAANGCPSINTLNLTVNTNAGSTEDVAICDSYTWNVPTYVLDTTTDLYVLGDAISNTYTESGVKTVTYVDANGCQGTATLNLTINVNEGTVENVAECQSYTWAVTGLTYTTSDTITAPIFDGNGCEGTATLNLTIGTMRTFVNQ